MILKRIGIVFSVITVFILKSNAQVDPHFTQYYIYPLYVNPAMTGGSDGDYRVSGIFRNQWGTISNPFRTVGVSFDKRTEKNIAWGVNLLNQSAGDGGFNYLNAYGSAAYQGVKFGKNDNHRIVFAIQAGIINRRIDKTKFKTGEQWNPITGYNASLATGEEGLMATQSTVLDIGAGALYYDASPDKKANLFAGVSAFHLNRPKDAFISNGNVELEAIPLRYLAHGGVSFNLSNKTRVVPNAIYMVQGTAREVVLGTYVQLNVNPETDFMVGGYYRLDDAFAPFVGVDWKEFLFGVSYDVNASKLGAWNRNVNAFELSLTYRKRKPGQSIYEYIRCPRL
ncbi:MAG: PorP/SprF family type IX secretion system membrane protein [Bacteroidota bacterium]|jgi:type IX secretion system PorP/SprF family membrane protein